MNGEEPPGERYWSLVEPIWRLVNVHARPGTFLEQFRTLNPVVGHLFAAHWCQSEVRNGGLHQFFSNSTGVLAPEALAAFRAMGLTEWAAILEEAMRFFGDPYPRDHVKRQELLARLPSEKREEWDPFDRLNERFYEWLHVGENRWERTADGYAACRGDH